MSPSLKSKFKWQNHCWNIPKKYQLQQKQKSWCCLLVIPITGVNNVVESQLDRQKAVNDVVKSQLHRQKAVNNVVKSQLHRQKAVNKSYSTYTKVNNKQTSKTAWIIFCPTLKICIPSVALSKIQTQKCSWSFSLNKVFLYGTRQALK